MGEMLLVKLDGKRVHEGNEFEVEQSQHRGAVQIRLKNIHRDIVATMKKTYEVRLTYM